MAKELGVFVGQMKLVNDTYACDKGMNQSTTFIPGEDFNCFRRIRFPNNFVKVGVLSICIYINICYY